MNKQVDIALYEIESYCAELYELLDADGHTEEEISYAIAAVDEIYYRLRDFPDDPPLITIDNLIYDVDEYYKEACKMKNELQEKVFKIAYNVIKYFGDILFDTFE